ncbi:MAG: oligosaccharide flippase family protein [Clostridiaceae bacterium]
MSSQSTGKGFAILTIGTFLGKILSLAYIPILQGVILNADGYGIYAFTYIVFTFIYVITNSGVSIAVSKTISELVALENYRDALRTFKISRSMVILIGLIMNAIMLMFSQEIANAMQFPQAALALKAISPAIFITSVVSVYRGYFQGRQNMTPTAVSNVLEQLVNVIFSLVFGYIGLQYSLEWAVAGATVGTTMGSLVALIYLIYVYERFRRSHKEELHIKTKRLGGKRIVRKLLKYTLPIAISQGLIQGGNVIDAGNIKARLLVAGFTENLAYEKFGILNNYITLIQVPITLITALSMAVLPAISEAAALDLKKEIERQVNFAIKLCLIVAIPFMVGMSVLSEPMYKLIFPSSVYGYTMMKYGAILIIFWSLVQILSTIIQSLGKPMIATMFMAIGIGIKILVSYLLVQIPSINIYGGVISNISAFVFTMIAYTIYISRVLKIRIRFMGQLIKSGIASLLMGVVALASYELFAIILGNIMSNYMSNFLALMLAAPIAGYTYLVGSILTRGINLRDINSISSHLLRILPNSLKQRLH